MPRTRPTKFRAARAGSLPPGASPCAAAVRGGGDWASVTTVVFPWAVDALHDSHPVKVPGIAVRRRGPVLRRYRIVVTDDPCGCVPGGVTAEGPRPRTRQRRGRLEPRAAWVVGVAALFSGAALLGTILFGLSLSLGLVVVGGMAAAATAIALSRMRAEERARVRAVVLAGVVAGLTATICYDVAKVALSQLDPSPYNPFEATRAFGILLIGDAAPEGAIQGVGVALHLLNGTAFGVAFTVLFGREGRPARLVAVLTGVAWGLFLELFQLTLYPGWLDIRAYREFATISALSHVVYGATLGLIGHRLLRRFLGGHATS